MQGTDHRRGSRWRVGAWTIAALVLLLPLVIGAVIARFKPDGMARTLFVTALAQALVGVIRALQGAIVFLSGFFAALWLLSAYLFRKAAREQASAEAAP